MLRQSGHMDTLGHLEEMTGRRDGAMWYSARGQGNDPTLVNRRKASNPTICCFCKPPLTSISSRPGGVVHPPLIPLAVILVDNRVTYARGYLYPPSHLSFPLHLTFINYDG
jgi:hypothetical protein